MKRGPYLTLNWVRDYIEKTAVSRDPQDLLVEVESHFTYHLDNQSRFLRRARGLIAQALSEIVAPEPAPPPQPAVAGVLAAPEDTREQAVGDTFVFTSAQANTFLNEKFWASLMHLVRNKNAELHISRFTYNKQQFGKNSVKPGSHEDADGEDIWFDPRVLPYVSDAALQITDDLVWCGDLNIIPTRVDPINGFENHGRGASVIIPHTKMAMRSIPTMKWDDARFAYSTGTVTARNYIEKAAGQKASLHHVYGALLVEVDRKTGQWWARQLNADTDGCIYDLDGKWTPTGICAARVAAKVLTHGDLHGNKFNTELKNCISGVINRLMPEHQVFHDTVDFQPRNHHNIKDPHFLHKMRMEGCENVEAEFKYIGDVLGHTFARDYSTHHIITSNHDQAVEQWLRNPTGFYDPVNMTTWLEQNLKDARCREQRTTPRPFMRMLARHLRQGFKWHFIHEDDSLVIDNIQYGLHGHLGPNGARGNPKNLRIAGKAVTGHTHSAGIIEGVYTVGVFGKLDMGYNKGLSGWSHSFCVTYPNGKRTICTIKGNRAWR